MKVLQIHNQYFQGLGGEDSVVELERELLAGGGHDVRQYIASTAKLKGAGLFRYFLAGIQTVWSFAEYRRVAREARAFRPDVAHVHNTFPLLSPSVYWALKRQGIPVVQTVHNYRLLCANAIFLRDLEPCKLCHEKNLLFSVRFRCYKHSYFLSLLWALMIWSHRRLGTYRTKVDSYILLHKFHLWAFGERSEHFPRIRIKPNFVMPPKGPTLGFEGRAADFLVIGNLSQAKGTDIVLEAFREFGRAGRTLRLLGKLELQGGIREEGLQAPGVEWLGHCPRQQVLEEIGKAKWVIIASRMYEGLSMNLLEAMVAGTPVLSADIGSFGATVEDSRCGLTFRSGDAGSLAACMAQALAMPSAAWQDYSRRASGYAHDHFLPQDNLRMLEGIYEEARRRGPD